MPRKEFEAFTRLDASDVNTYLMDQSVMSFAGTAARGSAIPTPVEGMLSYLEDTNDYEYYNSTWEKLIAPTGITLIKTQTIGTAVSSVTVTDAFSSTFDNYKVIISGGVASAAVGVAFKLGASSVNYYQVITTYTYTPAANVLSGANNGSAWGLTGEGNTTFFTINMDILSPNQAKPTIMNNSYVGASLAGWGGGYHSPATAFTDFTISSGGSTLTGGTIAVYGYRKTN
jgi:hypothetical protein